jgi:hypothetical protein
MTTLTGRIIEAAKDLKSEHGENPEYDRALVELSMRVLALSEDDRWEVERVIGIIRPRHIGTPHYGPVTTVITCSCGWSSGTSNERRVDSAIEFNQHITETGGL